MSPLVYCLPYLIPLTAAIGLGLGGWYTFTTLVVAFVILPVFDHLVGINPRNPSISEEQALKNNPAFTWALLMFLPVQALAVIGGAWCAAHLNLSALEWVGFVLSVGTATGAIGITISHELCHRGNAMQRWTGFGLLSLVCYAHFGIEHVVGHHARVSTPSDPATSRLGEGLYRFLPRTIMGSLASVFAFESLRLTKRRLSPWSLRNRLWWCFLSSIAIAVLLWFFWGGAALGFFLTQSAFAIFLLESVNYIEHYGLRRREIAPGRYEKVGLRHSWNASHRISNIFLFGLQRHSDHHAHPHRPYQILRHHDAVPQMPFGYPTMVMLATIPPLWRRVMDPKVHALDHTPLAGVIYDKGPRERVPQPPAKLTLV
jgi:alkane 1-monooxygenase